MTKPEPPRETFCNHYGHNPYNCPNLGRAAPTPEHRPFDDWVCVCGHSLGKHSQNDKRPCTCGCQEYRDAPKDTEVMEMPYCPSGKCFGAGMDWSVDPECPHCNPNLARKTGTPETPSGPQPCDDCYYDPCPKTRGETCRCPCHNKKGETPSALSAAPHAQDDENYCNFSRQECEVAKGEELSAEQFWIKTRPTMNPSGFACEFADAFAATLREKLSLQERHTHRHAIEVERSSEKLSTAERQRDEWEKEAWASMGKSNEHLLRAEAAEAELARVILQLRRYRAHHELLMKMQDNGTGCTCELCKQTDPILAEAALRTGGEKK
jgi:hypothetical protein